MVKRISTKLSDTWVLKFQWFCGISFSEVYVFKNDGEIVGLETGGFIIILEENFILYCRSIKNIHI